MTLARRLALLVLAALLPTLAIQGWFALEQRRGREAALHEAALRQTRAVQADLARTTDGVHQLLISLSQLPAIRGGDVAGCTGFLRAVAEQSQHYVLLGANATDGTILCTSTGAAVGAYSNAGRAYHQRALAAAGFTAGDLVTGVATGHRSIHFALPFRRPDGEVGGIVLASLDQERLSRQLAQAAVSRGAVVLAIDPGGTVVAGATGGQPVLEGWVGRPASDALRTALRPAEAGVVALPDPAGLPRLFGVLPPDPALGGLTVAVGLDRRAAFADLDAAFERSLLGLVLGGLLALGAGLLAARGLVLQPVRRLTLAAERVGGGDHAARSDFRAEAGTVPEVAAALHPISSALVESERERDEAALARRRGEARLAGLLAVTPAGIVEYDLDGRVVYANPAAERLLGAGPGSLLGLSHADPCWAPVAVDGDPVPPDCLPSAWALRGEVLSDYEFRVTALDGHRATLLADVVPLRGAAGAVTGAFMSFQDVTARHEGVDALRRSEARYRALFEAIDAGFCIIELRFDAAGRAADYRFVEVNPAFAGQTGLADAEGRWMRDLAPSHEQHWFDLYGDVARTGEPARFENEAEALGRWYDVHAFRVGEPAEARVAILFNDITARRRIELALQQANATLESRVAERTADLDRTVEALHAEARDRQAVEDQLRQSQKMEAVGQLTGGIAHDFNNLLTIIRSSVDFLRRPDLTEARRARYVEAIASTVERTTKLTGQLLAFARRQPLKPVVFDVGQQVEGVIDLVRPIVGARVNVELERIPEPCYGQADVSQFETALINLAVNARDAMDGEGRLTFQIAAVTEVPPTRGHRGATGEFVAVSVADSGRGIDPGLLGNIFEPFFTTKAVGKGTGLGLSQVFGFAKQSGGEIDVRSSPGEGATFTLYLPRVRPSPQPTDAASDPSPEPAAPAHRVLLVEDNEAVGEFATEILSDLGYRPSWAGNADQALRLLSESEGRFDVLFSDVVMPGMSGIELAETVRRQYPEMPILLTSGYSHVIAEEGTHGFELLQKPYSVDALSRMLQQVIAGHRPG